VVDICKCKQGICTQAIRYSGCLVRILRDLDHPLDLFRLCQIAGLFVLRLLRGKQRSPACIQVRKGVGLSKQSPHVTIKPRRMCLSKKMNTVINPRVYSPKFNPLSFSFPRNSQQQPPTMHALPPIIASECRRYILEREKDFLAANCHANLSNVWS